MSQNEECLGNSLPYPKTLPGLAKDRNRSSPSNSRKTPLTPSTVCAAQVEALHILEGTEKVELRAG